MLGAVGEEEVFLIVVEVGLEVSGLRVGFMCGIGGAADVSGESITGISERFFLSNSCFVVREGGGEMRKGGDVGFF